MSTISSERALAGKKYPKHTQSGLTNDRLSAIMLGRLKLSVTDARSHYQDVGDHVFRDKYHNPLARKQVKYFIPELDFGRMEDAMKAATVPRAMRTDDKSANRYIINTEAEKQRMRDDNQESSRR
jgi:hypothetical protein